MPVARDVSLGSDAFLWGLDLFNHGFYWEAHEAWEGLWQIADRGGPSRPLFKGLILLSAAGVKLREGKHAAALRHAGRAAALLRRLGTASDLALDHALGVSPSTLADHAEAGARNPVVSQAAPCLISSLDRSPRPGHRMTLPTPRRRSVTIGKIAEHGHLNVVCRTRPLQQAKTEAARRLFFGSYRSRLCEKRFDLVG
jgi:hypothetical protein